MYDKISPIITSCLECFLCGIKCKSKFCCCDSSFEITHQSYDSNIESTCCSGSCKISRKSSERKANSLELLPQKQKSITPSETISSTSME